MKESIKAPTLSVQRFLGRSQKPPKCPEELYFGLVDTLAEDIRAISSHSLSMKFSEVDSNFPATGSLSPNEHISCGLSPDWTNHTSENRPVEFDIRGYAQ